ncbi:MAG: hypothetical protein KDA25_06600 [Phycisphaerales bacterium]|nr:hypothetical protein [Phycisphaerales bacterium]
MARRQFVILSRQSSPNGELRPIGTRKEILRDLFDYNTGPDRPDADDFLYGPGILIELPPGTDPVSQLLLTFTEEEIAWPVLMRLARAMTWKILDPTTGRELTP